MFRHNALSTPYAELNPRGMDIDFYGTKEIHRWVVRAWKRARGIESDDAA